jgi:hypothetical protein
MLAWPTTVRARGRRLSAEGLPRPALEGRAVELADALAAESEARRDGAKGEPLGVVAGDDLRVAAVEPPVQWGRHGGA